MGQPRIHRIASIEDWDGLVTEAAERPVWIFKHSVICPMSTTGRDEYERFVAAAGNDSEHDSLFAIIEVQNARDVSNEIAVRTGVRHETPQAILLVGGTVCWHGSHWDVTASTLARAAAENAATAGCE